METGFKKHQTIIAIFIVVSLILFITSNITFAKDNKLLAIEQRVRDIITKSQSDNGLIYRADGWCYAVDMGNLLIYAALSKDEVLFNSLLATLNKYFIINERKDDNADFTVAWRVNHDIKPDASGTTETLRILKGIWYGYKQWGKPELKELAIKMTAAYSKHQTTVNGIWFIRNYYNYGTKIYATNSYTIDYDPDLLFDIGTTLNNGEIISVAEKSLQIIVGAQIPNGLIHTMIDPEVSTLYPGLNSSCFSPNFIMKPGDSAEIAITTINKSPESARKILSFGKKQWPYLYNAYSNNEPIDRNHASTGHLANMLVIGDRLGDSGFASTLADKITADISLGKSKSIWDFTNVLMAVGYCK